MALNPQIMVNWSDDGGHSYGNEHWRSIGKIGNYETRVEFKRLGISRDRVYQLRITDAVKIAVIGGTIKTTGLRS